jgi:hypothetical protein
MRARNAAAQSLADLQRLQAIAGGSKVLRHARSTQGSECIFDLGRICARAMVKKPGVSLGSFCAIHDCHSWVHAELAL